jgi:hypothetical protein
MPMHVGEAFLHKPEDCYFKVRIHTTEIRREFQRRQNTASFPESVNVQARLLADSDAVPH